MDEKQIRLFCDNFAYRFVTSLSIEAEFGNVKGKQMKKIYDGLRMSLYLDIQDFIEKKGGDNGQA